MNSDIQYYDWEVSIREVSDNDDSLFNVPIILRAYDVTNMEYKLDLFMKRVRQFKGKYSFRILSIKEVRNDDR